MGEMHIGEARKELYSCGAMVEEHSGGSMKDLNSAVGLRWLESISHKRVFGSM